MRFKTNLVVGAIFMALLGFVYFYEIKGGEQRQADADQAKVLADFSEHETQRLVVDRGDTVVVLEKDQGVWWLRQPVAAEADGEAVDRYLRNLRETERDRVVEDSAAVASNSGLLAKYGLQTPRLRVRVETADAVLDTFVFGADSPTERFTYIRQSGANPEIFTVRAWRYDNLDKGVFDLRDRRVLPFDKAAVMQLSLEPAAGERVLLVKDGFEWRLQEPVAVAADQAAVEALLNVLDGAKAEVFVVEEADDQVLASYGLGTSPATLELSMLVGEDRAEKRLVVGVLGNAKGYYAQDMGRAPVFEADSSTVHGLLKSVADLRDRKPVRFERDAVDVLVLERADSRLKAVKDTAGVWVIVEPHASEAKSWRFNSLLTALEQIEVSGFIADGVDDLEVHDLASPQLKVSLQAGGEDVGSYGFSVAGDKVNFCVYGVASVYTVGSAVWDEVDLDMDDLVQQAASPADAATETKGE
jgi:hypothetical protein